MPIEDSSLFPKLLHFLWLPHIGDMPRNERENIENWIDLNPEYGAMLWDHDRILHFLHRFYPKFAQIWLGLRMSDGHKQGIVKQLDLARYLIMHHYGGCYFDNDTAPVQRLSEFWKSDRVVGRTLREVREIPDDATVEIVDWDSYDIIVSADNFGARDYLSTVTNAQIFSVPGCEFWLRVVARGMPEKDGPVLSSFGTWTLTDQLREEMKGKTVNAMVLPAFYFNWVPRMMGNDFPPFMICAHENKISWGDHSLEQPWRA